MKLMKSGVAANGMPTWEGKPGVREVQSAINLPKLMFCYRPSQILATVFCETVEFSTWIVLTGQRSITAKVTHCSSFVQLADNAYIQWCLKHRSLKHGLLLVLQN